MKYKTELTQLGNFSIAGKMRVSGLFIGDDEDEEEDY